jgi:hypothetical protein
MIYTPKENLVQDLEQYGEDAVAAQVKDLSQIDYDRLGDIAFEHACTGMLIAKALALAAVEVIEGKPRELKRKRRVFKRGS